MNEHLQSYKSSLQRLREVLGLPKSVVHRDAAIQRFEFTVELAWKCIQSFLRDKGIVCRSPKDCLREAFRYGLIADDPRWLQMMEERNLTVHTYNEQTAEAVYERLPGYLDLFDHLDNRCTEL